jgi:hypothetical protein
MVQCGVLLLVGGEWRVESGEVRGLVLVTMRRF